jgi:hypothetical protein
LFALTRKEGDFFPAQYAPFEMPVVLDSVALQIKSTRRDIMKASSKKTKGIAVVVSMLLLMAMVAVPAHAKKTLYNFTFLDPNGNAYCDGFKVFLYGSPQSLVDGYLFNAQCQGANPWVNGFKAGIPAVYQYNATGATLVISDPEFGDGAAGGVGTMWLVNPTYQTWVVYQSQGGQGEFVQNFGTWVNGRMESRKASKSALQR